MESPFYISYPVAEPPVPAPMLMGDLSHGEGLDGRMGSLAQRALASQQVPLL